MDKKIGDILTANQFNKVYYALIYNTPDRAQEDWTIEETREKLLETIEKHNKTIKITTSEINQAEYLVKLLEKHMPKEAQK